MRKTLKFFCLFIVSFVALFIGMDKAFAVSFSEDTGAKQSVRYTSNATTAAFKYEVDGEDVSDGHLNGFCMQPRYSDHDSSFTSVTTFSSSNDSTYSYTIPGTSNKLPYRAIMYYTYNAPGWTKNSSTLTTFYSNHFSGHSSYTTGVYHAISALPMSYVLSNSSSFSGVTCGYTTIDGTSSSSACDWNLYYYCNQQYDSSTQSYYCGSGSGNKLDSTVNGWESDIKSLLSTMYTLWETDKSGASGFTAYYHNGSGQDLMVWKNVEDQKAYIKITKDFVPDSTAEVTFRLYKCTSVTNGKCTAKGSEIGQSVTISEGETGKLGLDTNGNALLELNTPYLISEDGEVNGKKGNYAVTFTNVDHVVTIPYNGSNYTYGQISIGTGSSDTIGYYNSTPAKAVNTQDKGYLEVKKGPNDIDFSTYHFAYDVYNSTGTSKLATIYTNNDGIATYGKDANENGTLALASSYIIREKVNDSNGNAIVYKYDSSSSSYSSIGTSDAEYNDMPVVKPSSSYDEHEGTITITISSVGSGTAGQNRKTYTNEYRTCFSIEKDDSSGSKITSSNATFEIYTNSSCTTSANKSGTTSNGVVTFYGLTGTTYYAKETVAPDGYTTPAANCTKVTAVERKKISSTCKVNKIQNGSLYLAFYKEKEDGTRLTEATFKIKDSNNKYLTVSEQDSDGCWIYTGENTTGTSISVSNSGNGLYCVTKLPAGTYTAVEQATGNDSYWIDGGTLSVSTGTGIPTKAPSNTIKNSPYVVTFYKTKDTTNGESMQNAKFKVREANTSNYVKVDGKSTASGYNGCYIYNGTGTEAQGSELASDSNGRICIIRTLKNKTYEVIETDSGDPAYYADSSISVSTKKAIESKNTNNTMVNEAYKLSFYKVREDGTPLSGAKFKVKKGNNFITASGKGSNSAYPDCYIYTGTTSTEASGTEMTTDSNGRICVAKVPNETGYTSYEKSTGDPAYYVFENGVINLTVGKDIQGKTAANSVYNKPYLINFYKVLEDNTTPVGGAEFVITNPDGKYVTVSGTSDVNGYKGCYIYSGLSTTKTAATKLVSSTTNVTNGVNVGEVCVIRMPNVPQTTYKVTETKPVEYHTFGTEVTKNFVPTTTRQPMTSDREFINYKTEFKFTKTVSEENGYGEPWDSLTTEELKNIPFTIYDSNGNPVSVVKTSDGKYEYAGNTIDGTSGISTTVLNLDGNRELYVYHLPKGTYTIKEVDCCCEDACTSPSTTNCYGFYSPKYENKPASSYTFTITDCSTSKTTGKDEKGNNVCSTSITTQTLDNKPTEVDFTKTDFYSYVNPEDTVKFEDEEEISAFDGITFKVYYLENGVKHYLDFAKVKDAGTCKDENSYAEYRYMPTSVSGVTTTQELHTCGGHIKITHLCRGRKYYIEEVSVPGNSVFTLPETEEARTRELDLECCQENEDEKPTTTTIIEDKPTKVSFEKRDSKYGYLIPDETTTFEVYKCEEGVSCHPSDYSTVEERSAAGIKRVKFNPRGQITGDEEDPGKEVYRMVVNDTNVTNYVTDLHPYEGRLVLRYLQGGYQYVLLETVSPLGYTLPQGRRAETAFTVSVSTVDVDQIDVVNKPTSLLIRKYDDAGNLLPGAEFRIYEKTTCNSNLTAKAEITNGMTPLNLKTIRDGVYENREVKDTNKLITCADKPDNKCSDVVTTLTLDKYVETWANFDNSVNQYNEDVEIKEGEILIQYLDYDRCYIIEEVKAPTGYSLPENDEERFIKVAITRNDDVVDTFKELVNKPTKFTFYKFDEYNNLIDGGEYKLQKLNSNKKYEDITVTEEEIDGKLYYKVDSASENKVIRTEGGSATVYYLEEGQYRIVETKAPEGMELPTKEINVAVFYVDEGGNVVGNSIITNKPKTEKIEIKPKASAELVVNIATGVARVRYGLIIGIIVITIGGLIYIQRVRKKD